MIFLAKAKPSERSVQSDMSKVQYIIIVAFVGFYAMLFVSLLVRACAGFIRPRHAGAPQIEKVTKKVLRARKLAWTRAVWREKLMPRNAAH